MPNVAAGKKLASESFQWAKVPDYKDPAATADASSKFIVGRWPVGLAAAVLSQYQQRICEDGKCRPAKLFPPTSFPFEGTHYRRCGSPLCPITFEELFSSKSRPE